jgi:hypothetical protein
MTLGQRDQEAFDLVASRSFADAYLLSLDLEMLARRLTVKLYGPLRAGQADTYLGTLTFFGTSAFGGANPGSTFPDSAHASGLTLSYGDNEEAGSAELRGSEGWSFAWSFDGLAYEEHPAILTSLVDDV